MNPLAYSLRPQTLDEVVGQDHLVKIFKKMISNNKLVSIILYGEPGIGKTTLATLICKEILKKYDSFNASSDSKEKLKQLIPNNQILIVDEIHRMKKDTQDYLLPFVEKGDIILIGLTTINPYRSVNPAIRSRSIVYKLNKLNEVDLLVLLNRCLNFIQKESPSFRLNDEVKNYIINNASYEARTLINFVEVIYNTYQDQEITLELAKSVILKPNINYDKFEDGYYNTLSGLQKSIRGSDVDASLHYLAKLIYTEDLLPLIRRLLVIFYEDISVANPSLGPNVKAACDSALELGLPEARIPLASIVVQMALSPKSNSTYLAIDKALSDIEKGLSGPLPNHLKNVYDFEEKSKYLYPHDYPGGYVIQQYLPDVIKDRIYYIPKTTSNYEKSLKERYDAINNYKKSKK